jgi:hypothetical protein
MKPEPSNCNQDSPVALLLLLLLLLLPTAFMAAVSRLLLIP